MESKTQKNIETWLNGNYDAESKAVIRKLMTTDLTALEDAFYCDLEFGTGGLRGIMGVGTNRMNKYTVGMATQGLANYLKEQFPNQTIKVAIAYDSRNNSRYFSEVAAEVMSANGVFTYLFDALRPTPELSFAIRHLGCQSGIVITASHNPKEYNGYKAYWTDGGQLVPPHDKNVIEHVRKIKSIDDVNFTRNEQFIQIIGKEIDEIYIGKLKTLSLHPELIEKHRHIPIVYTPLHGTGRELVPAALKAFGFENVQIVAEQSVADGNFPTVASPNPEETEALTLAIKQAEQTDAELVIATDPDADRVGIAIKNNRGEFILPNGNMTASLIVYYMLKQWKQAGKLNGKQFIVKTVVTTELLKDIANQYDVECFDVLTGFKYIAEKIREVEHEKQYICGGEESYGYMIGSFSRDKDAVIAACIIAEIAAWAKEQGKSLFDILTDIYLEFGFYRESLLSITKKGINGALEIKQMMQNFRTNPPQTIDGQKIIRIKDYKTQQDTDLISGQTEAIHLPVSDVLQFFLEDGSKVTMRPSGTEPKIKFYFSVKTALNDRNAVEETGNYLEEKIKRITSALKL